MCCGEARQNRRGEAGHGGGVAALGYAHLVKGGAGKAAGERAVETGDGEGEDGGVWRGSIPLTPLA